ncbi:hypothetical protein F5X98DRAFT_291829 [Xylaria grammica]|nr:hypothetical protein F5X98DRAFT_291829 [Xylaria grammica]
MTGTSASPFLCTRLGNRTGGGILSEARWDAIYFKVSILAGGLLGLGAAVHPSRSTWASCEVCVGDEGEYMTSEKGFFFPSKRRAYVFVFPCPAVEKRMTDYRRRSITLAFVLILAQERLLSCRTVPVMWRKRLIKCINVTIISQPGFGKVGFSLLNGYLPAYPDSCSLIVLCSGPDPVRFDSAYNTLCRNEMSGSNDFFWEDNSLPEELQPSVVSISAICERG